MRVLFGPIQYYGVVFYHYASRATCVSFITMLTFTRVLMTLFIIDFSRMTALPEKKVLIYMGLVTFIINVAYLLQEAVVRSLRGLEHFSRGSLSFYLGKVVRFYGIWSFIIIQFNWLKGNIDIPIIDTGGTGDLFTCPLLGLVISGVIYMVFRTRNKRTLLQNYHSSVTESDANGRNSYFLNITMFIIGLIFTVGIILKTVSFINYMLHLYTWLTCSFSQKIRS